MAYLSAMGLLPTVVPTTFAVSPTPQVSGQPGALPFAQLQSATEKLQAGLPGAAPGYGYGEPSFFDKYKLPLLLGGGALVLLLVLKKRKKAAGATP
jgi:hypothetical protein